MIKYHTRQYPNNIPLDIKEVAGHFDIANFSLKQPYSLHTEYSYMGRTFINKYLKNYSGLVESNKNGVPQLWKNELWAKEFALFLIDNINGSIEPTVIEVHPPFKDYTYNTMDFIERYVIFEEIIKERFPHVELHIENRCGSRYSGGKFLVSNYCEIVELCNAISQNNLSLKIAYDVPQLYTAHNVTMKSSQNIISLLESMKEIRQFVSGVHIWGKKFSINGRRVAHHGDLNTYFMENQDLKNAFLQKLKMLFDDDIKRNLVLEVNSSDNDMISIIQDLYEADFKYV